MANVALPLEVIEDLPALRPMDIDELKAFARSSGQRYPSDADLRKRVGAIKALATRRRNAAQRRLADEWPYNQPHRPLRFLVMKEATL